MVMAAGIVLGLIFFIVECLYFTRRLAKQPATVTLRNSLHNTRTLMKCGNFS